LMSFKKKPPSSFPNNILRKWRRKVDISQQKMMENFSFYCVASEFYWIFRENCALGKFENKSQERTFSFLSFFCGVFLSCLEIVGNWCQRLIGRKKSTDHHLQTGPKKGKIAPRLCNKKKFRSSIFLNLKETQKTLQLNSKRAKNIISYFQC
jgi:hypothetical protein